MPTSTRKSKFLRSKSIYSKRDQKRKSKPFFERYDLSNILVSGDKRKRITPEIIHNLISRMKVVTIEYEKFLTAAVVGVIIACNPERLLCLDYQEQDFGCLRIIPLRRIYQINTKNIFVHTWIKKKLRIYFDQQQYFQGTHHCLDKIPNSLREHIFEYVSYPLAYQHFLDHNVESNLDLFTFLKNKNYVIEFFVEDYCPVLHSKIIEVGEDSLILKIMDLNGVFVSNHVSIMYSKIEYLSINPFQNDRCTYYYLKNEAQSDKYHQMIQSIDSRYRFLNTFDGGTFQDNVYNLQGPENNQELNLDELQKIDYVCYYQEEFLRFQLNYIPSKGFLENLNILFPNELLSTDLNLENINHHQLFDIYYQSDDQSLENCYLISKFEFYIVVQDTDGDIFLIFKKNIVKLQNKHQSSLHQDLLVPLSIANKNYRWEKLKNNICFLKTKFFSGYFLIDEYNQKEFIVRPVYDDYGFFYPHTIFIKTDLILCIQLDNYELRRLNEETKYLLKNSCSNNSNYQTFCQVSSYTQKYLKPRVGLNWYIKYILTSIDNLLIFCLVIVETGKRIDIDVKIPRGYKDIQEEWLSFHFDP